jgi:hypothetical protein
VNLRPPALKNTLLVVFVCVNAVRRRRYLLNDHSSGDYRSTHHRERPANRVPSYDRISEHLCTRGAFGRAKSGARHLLSVTSRSPTRTQSGTPSSPPRTRQALSYAEELRCAAFPRPQSGRSRRRKKHCSRRSWRTACLTVHSDRTRADARGHNIARPRNRRCKNCPDPELRVRNHTEEEN